MSTYEARMKRINDAVALTEPDRVPIAPPMQCYPIYHSGLTMKDVLYDYDKGADAIVKYVQDYQPDNVMGHQYIQMGQGPMFELMQPTTITWPGQPGTAISDESIYQFLERPILLEEDMPFFDRDYSGWLLEKAFPDIFGLLKPFAGLGVSRMGAFPDLGMLAAAFSTPEMRATMETFYKINDMRNELNGKTRALDAKLEELGYPVLQQGMAAVPYDAYSDFFRGTLDAMEDLFTHMDTIQNYREAQMEYTLELVRIQGQFLKGKWVFMALHKGMDTFLSDEMYRDLYWKDLQTIIEEIIANDMVPYIYTEGKYDTRLKYLKEVTSNKVVYHFEEVDMLEAKRVLGDTACISGGFPVYLLTYGTKQQVIDECKRLIDGCAAGGGFIFETGYGFDYAKPENVEAMFETVKEYGKR